MVHRRPRRGDRARVRVPLGPRPDDRHRARARARGRARATSCRPAPRLRPTRPSPRRRAGERYPRSKFLEASTLGLGGVIGGLVTVPVLGFMVAPPFLKQGQKDHDLGPLDRLPRGEVRDRDVHVRPEPGRGLAPHGVRPLQRAPRHGQPSFTIISNHCAHLGCPVQPNGPLDDKNTKQFADVTLIPTVSIAGFGCPCHGGQYDTEGNRIAGPPVRALDRYSFSIRERPPLRRQAVLGLARRGHRLERADPQVDARVPGRARRTASSPGSIRSSRPTDGNDEASPGRSRSSRRSCIRSTGSRSAPASSAASSTSSSGRSPATPTGSRRSARRR